MPSSDTINRTWQLPDPIAANPLEGLDLPLPLRAVIARRGVVDQAAAAELLDPPAPPEASRHFPDLGIAIGRLQSACRTSESVAICGDYDADGMTSAALLMSALQSLGAQPIAAIPSRMDEGYGLNTTMVKRLHDQGTRLLVTVDNGVSAQEALELAAELKMEVIITDHHRIPEPPPAVLALLHPAITPEDSPYRCLAGVGLAFVLAAELARSMDRLDAIGASRDLFCVGTVADMAPLTGANRAWLKQGLQHLHQTRCKGLHALQMLAGLGDRPLLAEDIGFQLAPRINAVGRLGEPDLVVELLTADSDQRAMELARQCDELNRQRRDLCDAIEAEAIALIEADRVEPSAFLLLAQNHWHHGVIGIVAARLMERYQRPTALLAGEGDGHFRASVRAPQGFAVDQALETCGDILERFGGHPAAGGFTVNASNVSLLQERLNALAEAWLARDGQAMAVAPEALLNFKDVNWTLLKAMQKLEPFGIGNPPPLFWARDCVVVEKRRLRGGHLQLKLAQGECQHRAIAWRWQSEAPLPDRVDVAFELKRNRWQGEERLQLEMKALRRHCSQLNLHCNGRVYAAQRGDNQEVVLTNPEGQRIKARVNAKGRLKSKDKGADHPYVVSLLAEAALGLGLST